MQGYRANSVCFGSSIEAEFSFRPKNLMMALAILVLLLFVSRVRAEEPEKVHLYFFTNQGCAPCRQVEPSIAQLKNEGYPVSTVFLDQQPELAQRFSIIETPTVVMIANERMVGRHAGLINAATLREWFTAVGVSPDNSGNQYRQRENQATRVPVSQRMQLANTETRPDAAEIQARLIPDSKRFQRQVQNQNIRSTMHEGTARPANQAEVNAMQATVRLKVQDVDGISYATGTVIHCHDGECLVMTCGHVFREAGFKGQITAEYNFVDGIIKTGKGELIAYDSNARDVALVAVNTGSNIKPVKIARLGTRLNEEASIFTVGCDGGANPTIRHSRIKSHAIYDGAPKYDIYGRPAIGRSGGGMFNEDGELLGVCNAAAVKSDEGIYSALESIHWQIADARLAHLFVSESSNTMMLASTDQRSADIEGEGKLQRLNNRDARSNPVSWQNEDGARNGGREVIIIVRDKRNQKVASTIMLDNPTPQLLDYLNEMEGASREPRELDLARLRKSNDRGNRQ